MELSLLWFVLIAVLFSGFFFLEGFDYGVAIVMPFLGKDDEERRIIINTIGPHWDGNEVWLLTAGGAMFAAFPAWYATMFSGFYLALFLVLFALIIRVVGFEFRSKLESAKWRKMWDGAIFLGSLLPAILFGTAMANLIQGVPIAMGKYGLVYTGNFFDLLSVYTLLAGVTTCVVFIYHGLVFLALKTEGAVQEKVLKLSGYLGLGAVLFVVLLGGANAVFTDMYRQPAAIVFAALAFILIVLSVLFAKKGSFGRAMLCNGLCIICGTAALFAGLFPRVMVSSVNAAFNLTVYNASSSPYTLKVMTIVALTLVPVVLIYQAWTYWIFRKRVTAAHLEY